MRTACFCFPGGNETPGFQMFLSGFVSIPPPKAGAPQGISLRAGPDRSDLVIITKILIEIRVRVQIHGDPVKLFAICLFLVPADPTCGAPRKKKMETKYTGELWEKRRAKPICSVFFLETRNAQGGTFLVSWKRNTQKIWVCFLCFLFPVFRLRP